MCLGNQIDASAKFNCYWETALAVLAYTVFSSQVAAASIAVFCTLRDEKKKKLSSAKSEGDETGDKTSGGTSAEKDDEQWLHIRFSFHRCVLLLWLS